MNAYTGQVPETLRPTDWRTRAACLGQWDAMHPDNNENEIAAAKAICARCPLKVRVECFWDAVRTGDNEHGIRAGMRASERRALLKQVRQRKQAAPPTRPEPKPVPKKREPARCGTRQGYRAHKGRGEDACAPCRRANADADNRLRWTGTTKELV